jgi:hypothetical protein
MKFIIYNPASQLFNFFEEAILYELNLKNIECIKYSNENLLDQDININPMKDIFLIIVNPHYIYDYPEIKKTILDISKSFKYKIFYLTEPINFIIEKRVFTDLIKIIKPYSLWTYSVDNFKKLNIYQPIYKVFPHYNKTLNFVNIDIDSIKSKNPNKIIFFGNINIVRSKICELFNDYLINITDAWTKIEWTDILNKYLFYLNIHRRDGCESFETFRIIPILANGGVVFSESVNKTEEEYYSRFNIIFYKKTELYNVFIEYIKTINYNEIYKKAKLFREYFLNNNIELDNFLEYHKNIDHAKIKISK